MIGVLARYGLGTTVSADNQPWMVFAINVVGSFALGFVVFAIASLGEGVMQTAFWVFIDEALGGGAREAGWLLTAQAAGDYAIGSNHVLPTGGLARKGVNLAILGGSMAVFALALWLVRSQATVDDVEPTVEDGYLLLAGRDATSGAESLAS